MGTSQRAADFTAFVAASSGGLTRTAWFLVGDVDLARELVQEAYVKAFLAWHRIRPGEALAYTRRVLVNLNIDRWRRHHRESVSDQLDRPVGSAEVVVDERDRIARMIATLPQQQRTVVVLRYFEDLSEAQVADHLGISKGSVKSAASRGLASLRAHYVPNGDPR